MLIAVDFDGTIVEHKYPAIGNEKPFAFATLRQLAADGNKLILWTVREGKLLDDALDYCRANGVEFYAVNSSIPNNSLFAKAASPRKIDADVYIDDRNIGGIPEWGDIYEIITSRRLEHHNGGREEHSGLLDFLFHRR